MNWVHNDGGRSKYFKGSAGDCAVRAMAIALNKDYKECYVELAEQHKLTTGKKSAREGIYKNDFEIVIARYGWHWMKAPVIIGRKARCFDIPGTIIARQARHYVAVIDGTVHDIFDSSDRMVYGYWSFTGDK